MTWEAVRLNNQWVLVLSRKVRGLYEHTVNRASIQHGALYERITADRPGRDLRDSVETAGLSQPHAAANLPGLQSARLPTHVAARKNLGLAVPALGCFGCVAGSLPVEAMIC